MSDDGWTSVPPRKKKHSTHGTVRIAFSQHREIDRDATVETLQAQYGAKKRSWMDSDARQQLFRIIERLVVFDEPQVKKCICLALGSLTQINLQNRHRSLLQLVVFMDVTDHLSKNWEGPFQIYAQDPAFTDVDKEFLATLGLLALEYNLSDEPVSSTQKIGPAAALFGDDTFVAEFCMEYNPGKAAQMLAGKNRLLIGAVRTAIERHAALNPSDLQAQKNKDELRVHYQWYKFPAFDDNTMALDVLDVLAAQREQEDQEDAHG